MKKWFAIVTMGLVGALVLGGAAAAEDPARAGEVRGTFVRRKTRRSTQAGG